MSFSSEKLGKLHLDFRKKAYFINNIDKFDDFLNGEGGGRGGLESLINVNCCLRDIIGRTLHMQTNRRHSVT